MSNLNVNADTPFSCLIPILKGGLLVCGSIAAFACLIDNWHVVLCFLHDAFCTVMNAITGHDKYFWTPVTVDVVLCGCFAWTCCAGNKGFLTVSQAVKYSLMCFAAYVCIGVALVRSATLSDQPVGVYRAITLIALVIAAFVMFFSGAEFAETNAKAAQEQDSNDN